LDCQYQSPLVRQAERLTSWIIDIIAELSPVKKKASEGYIPRREEGQLVGDEKKKEMYQ
jgi:hypothetical protein